MGTNFHTAWQDDVTEYKASNMNSPLSQLDKAFSYTKNFMASCAGEISYVDSELSWADTIKIAYIDEDGDTIVNTVSTNSIVLNANQFAYVDLSDTNNDAITVSVASITGEAASNFKANNRMVLAFRGTGNDPHFVNLQPKITNSYLIQRSFSGQPAASGEIIRYPFTETITFPTNFTNSQGSVRVAATSGEDAIITFHKNGTQFGYMQFASEQDTATFSGEATSFSATDIFTAKGPSPANGALEDLGVVLVGTKG